MAKKCKPERYYISRTAIFVSEKYDVPKIKNAIKKAGGQRVSESNAQGWGNQPKVVTFSACPEKLIKIKNEVSKSLGGLAKKWGVIAYHKDW